MLGKIVHVGIVSLILKTGLSKIFFFCAVAAVVVWLVTLWIMSSLPAKDFPETGIPFADKIVHVGYFFLGGFLASGTLSLLGWRGRHLFFATILLVAVIGAVDEWHQLYTPGRSGGDIGDWTADLTGGALGVLTLIVFHGWRRRD